MKTLLCMTALALSMAIALPSNICLADIIVTTRDTMASATATATDGVQTETDSDTFFNDQLTGVSQGAFSEQAELISSFGGDAVTAVATAQVNFFDNVISGTDFLLVEFNSNGNSSAEIFDDTLASGTTRHNLTLSFVLEEASTFSLAGEFVSNEESGEITDFFLQRDGENLFDQSAPGAIAESGELLPGNYFLFVGWQANAFLNSGFSNTSTAGIDFELEIGNAVPEPTVGIALLGLAGCLFVRRSR